MTIERSRPAALPSPKDALEQHLLRDIRAVNLPEPVREWRFAWCCQHPKTDHREQLNEHWMPPRTERWCVSCQADGTVFYGHGYKHERNWRFDLAWPVPFGEGAMLAVEVDGGTFSGGRHTRGTGYENDTEKLNEALLRGWRVLRVTKNQVEDGSALEWIERAFGRIGAKP